VIQRYQTRFDGEPRGGIMLLSSCRLAYAGRLGKPTSRVQGALTVYASLGGPFRLSIFGRSWDDAELAIVPPYVPHQFSTEDRRVAILQLELEGFDPANLPQFLTAAGGVVEPALLARIRGAFSRLLAGDPALEPGALPFDEYFFGMALPPRRLDPRVARVVERISRRPGDPLDRETAAELAALSFSRFSHLFRRELGTRFRCFRAWKRARALLAHAPRAGNLSDLALAMGYPDATHFSHAIRAYHGLRPRDIVSGLRQVAVYSQPGASVFDAPTPAVRPAARAA
jgi:AraC-like DNA-binding protein